MAASNAPFASFIIPTFNRAAQVVQAIDDALAQELPEGACLEVVVLDDGSTDDTQTRLAGRFGSDSRVRVLHQENGGVSRARNAAVAAARGTYLLFLDSDDRSHPTRLLAQTTPMEADRSLAFTVADATLASGKGTIFAQPRYTRPTSLEAMFHGAWATPSTVAIRREVARTVPFDPSYPCHEDTDFLYRLFEGGHRGICVEAVVGIYLDDVGGGVSDRLSDRSSLVREHWSRLLAQHYTALRASGRSDVYVPARVHRGLSRWYAAQRDFALERHHAWQWWRRRWWRPKPLWRALTAGRLASRGPPSSRSDR